MFSSSTAVNRRDMTGVWDASESSALCYYCV